MFINYLKEIIMANKAKKNKGQKRVSKVDRQKRLKARSDKDRAKREDAVKRVISHD